MSFGVPWGPTSAGKGEGGASGCGGHVLQVGKLRHVMSPRAASPSLPTAPLPSWNPPDPPHSSFILPVSPHKIPPSKVSPVQPLWARHTLAPGSGCMNPPEPAQPPLRWVPTPGVLPQDPPVPPAPNPTPWCGCEAWRGPVAGGRWLPTRTLPAAAPLRPPRAKALEPLPGPRGRASPGWPCQPGHASVGSDICHRVSRRRRAHGAGEGTDGTRTRHSPRGPGGRSPLPTLLGVQGSSSCWGHGHPCPAGCGDTTPRPAGNTGTQPLLVPALEPPPFFQG